MNLNVLSRSIKYIFRAFLFLLPFQTIWIYRAVTIQGAKWQYGTLGFYGTEILLWVGVILFMAWYLKKRKIFSSDTEFSWTKDRLFLFSCLVFLLYSFASIFWAVDQSLALQYSLWLLEAVLLISVFISGPFEPKKLVAWFTAGGALQAVLGIYQFATQSTFALDWLGLAAHPVAQSGVSVIEGGYIGRWLRAYGAFPHPNMLGGYLTLVVITLLSVISVRGYDFENKKVILTLVLMVLSAGVFVSFSRAAWLVLVVVLLFTAFHVFFHRKAHPAEVVDSLIVTTALFVILAIISYPLVGTRLSLSSATEQKSIDQRVAGLETSLELFENNALVGVGAGNYTAAMIEKFDQPGWFFQPVHNIFALFLVEFGLIGLVLLILAGIAYNYFMFYRRQVDPDDAFYLSMIIFAVLILGSFDHYLISSFVGLMSLAVVLGLFSRLHLHTSASEK
ncbi:MAG: O-antigen ligase family protein [Candidatus Paceibacteria bacterium]